MSAQATLTAYVQKLKTVTITRESNSEMIKLATAVHEEENRDFSGIKVEMNLKYGEHERQRLDVYYPSTAAPESKLPIVFFFHGGGMVFGDSVISPVFYANIGNYFSSNDCISVICAYRLLPEARHPDGAEDLTSALQWTIANGTKYGGDVSKITALGHSAGGSCIGTALWGGYLAKAGIQKQIATYVLLSAGLWYDMWNDPTLTNMSLYHRPSASPTPLASVEKVKAEDPIALFEAADKETVEGWGRMVFMLCEYEGYETVNGTMGCVKAYGEKVGMVALYETIEGENHVSYVYGIGTEGSRVGPRLLTVARG